jgi:transcriptional regulator with XRE-family HTH domain
MRHDSRMTSHSPTGLHTGLSAVASEGPGQAADGPAAVGRRIRELREARGISLSTLAKRAGIGKATLSRLETGAQNPTLETLYAVTGQLGVPLATVLHSTPAVIRGAAVEGTLLEVFTEPTATYELYRLRIAAGASQLSPAHPAGVTEHLTVFAGTLLAGPADAPGEAGPGAHLTWTSDVPHSYTATSTDDVLASLLIRSPRT